MTRLDMFIRIVAAATAAVCLSSLLGVRMGHFDIYSSVLLALLLVVEWVRTRARRRV